MSDVVAPGASHRFALRRGWRFVAAFGLLAWACVGTASAAPVDEQRVHAAYLMNFIRYTRWPDAGDQPVLACVLGSAELAGVMREAARKFAAAGGVQVQVRLLPTGTVAPALAEAEGALRKPSEGCQVLYVADSHRAWARAVVRAGTGRAVLTVGPGADFLEAGGMIGLYLEEGTIRFDVNPAAIRSSPVDVSSRIMALARPARRRH